MATANYSFIARTIIRLTRPFRPLIRLIAESADIRLNNPWTAIGQHPLVFEDSKEKYSQQIPKSVYFNTRSGKIVVGANTVFGEDVMVLTGKHNAISEVISEKDLHAVPDDGREVIIGRNCYIGSGAIIIGKVTIGDYAVIGAGSVVTKDVPPMMMYAGIPAQKIKDLKRND
ncbi:MAG TPA: acyltransferase [Dinghuibacter sp.]|jgi:acetyltransferase-like isoleucine patch superfamily enzyme|uniref:acyltransferase n=1 Tax=Dinghuibacter sp. TaxID=2024697 RepID=UPI002C905DAB|nr:acyltransferase [Dinghuibacter sp.]HTJ10956.1 acyltransferase [Dinghuibacter sp.]